MDLASSPGPALPGALPWRRLFDPFADATANGGTSYGVGGFLFGQVNSLGATWFALTNTPAPPATGFPLIVAGNLSYPGLPVSSGNSVQIPPTTGVMGRLTLGFTTTSGAAYYSFLLKVTDLSAINTTGTQNNYFAGFGDTIGPQNATLLRAATRIYTKRAGTGFNLGVARNSNTTSDWVFDTTPRNTNEVLFVVGSYDYNNHTANLWINPAASSFGATTAPAPTITATGGADLNANGIRAFVLGCRTNGPPGCLVDDVRVGSTWAIVTGGPGVAVEPTNQTQIVGSTAVFSVLATGAPSLVYHWRKNSLNLNDDGKISGANTATLTISNLLQADAGSYSVTITNSLGSTTSSLASLTVNDPAIITQPNTQVVTMGTNAVFQVIAAGTAPLSYRWYKEDASLVNGAKISGATTATLTVSNISSSDIGSYSVRVTNGPGSGVISSNAELYLTASIARRPNIIFILCDDLGYGDLGVLFQNGRAPGLPREYTPNLDMLASEGMQFRRHYCPAPICAPSRASLLLGMHQGHANVRDQQFDKALANNHTLGSVLKTAGYATAAIGKWGLAGDDLGGTTPADWPAYPTKRGFDYFFGYVRHGDGHEHYPKEAVNSTKIKECYDGTNSITPSLDKCYTADLFTARAKKWIADQHSSNPNQPFFLYLAFDTPHAAYELPTQAYPSGGGTNGGLQWLGTAGHMISTASGTIDSFIHPDYASATYDDDNNPLTPQVAWPEIFKRFATGVRRVDEAVGDMKKLLQDLALDTNTLVVFTSDNGPTIEDYLNLTPRYVGNFFDNFGPFDGVKRDTWEGGIRMPTLVRWPGAIPGGATNQSPSQFHDWMPTFCDLAGLPAPAHSDGVSLVPTLLGAGVQRPGTLYVEYYDVGSATPEYPEFELAHQGRSRNQMQVINLGGYQGVRYDIQGHSNNFEIYDVNTDPKQTINLATNPAFAALQQQMKDRVLQLRRPDSSAPRPYDGEFIPADSTAGVTNGLVDYAVYEGVWPWLPDTTMLASASTGRAAGLDLSVRTRDTNYAIAYTGFIRVPTSGDYTFYLNTDSGALFRVHDATVIDDDFTHVDAEVAGTIRLQAGSHAFRLVYRHGIGTNALDLKYSGPGISKQPVPLSALYAPCQTCSDGLFWFPFNQISGLSTTEAGGFATGQLTGGYTNDPEQWVAGRFNRALSFDGISNFVSVSGFDGITGATPRTCAAWVKTTSSASLPIISWGPNTTGNRWTLMLQGGNLRTEVSGGSVQGTRSLNDGQWHHVACAFESDGTADVTEAKLYVDGTPEGAGTQQPQAINTLSSGQPLIGKDALGRLFSGILDEVRIYDRVLNAVEIASLVTDPNQSAQAWHRQYFGATPPNWDGDDDNDGMTRLGEYAFGGQPFLSDPGSAVIFPRIVGSFFQVRYRRLLTGSHELTYQLQSSTDLKTWSPLSGSELVITPALLPGYEDVVFHGPSIVTVSPLFARLSVHAP